jgi:hypothetical protein
MIFSMGNVGARQLGPDGPSEDIRRRHGVVCVK